MVDSLALYLAIGAAIGSGLIAGIFFAFSNFVMRALASIPANSGIAAMQAINVTVLNPGFFTAFLGVALTCLVLIGWGATYWPQPSAIWFLLGSGLYLIGSFGVTARLNVPLNQQLATISPTKLESETDWRRYIARWTLWNHVRTSCSLLAALAFTAGVYLHKGD
ncbi:anthrone oxygenase family protein [Chitinivorax sp. B]|uniref:anthrone oxygenase family protein n=1 Tax=Chitinivorax sp. B TaxID=2502235 RepID=UPI0010F97828|nr:anthrone oxygenase family protein [Chitinivorax sp. B]